MKNLLNFKACLIGFNLFLTIFGAFGADGATVYFVPFEIETYIPITQATIESQAWEKWTISSKSETCSLFALVKHGNEVDFDENRVRGLIISANQTLFIDANGVASKGGKVGVKIDRTMFVKFGDSLGADQRRIIRNNNNNK